MHRATMHIPEQSFRRNKHAMKNLFLSICALTVTLTIAIAQQRETRNVGAFTKIAFRVPGKLYIKQGAPQKVEIEATSDLLKDIETEVEGNRLTIGKEDGWMNWDWDNDDKVTVYITVESLEGLSVSGSGDAIGQSKFASNSFKLNVSGSGSADIQVEAKDEIDADVSGSGDILLKGSCSRFNSSVSGSGKVNLDLAVTEKAEFGVSGSGKIEARGSASTVEAKISGSGKVLAANMSANTAEIKISGSGDVEVNVKNEIDATISGSGSVSYKGDPKKVNSNSSGSGKVRKMQ